MGANEEEACGPGCSCMRESRREKRRGEQGESNSLPKSRKNTTYEFWAWLVRAHYRFSPREASPLKLLEPSGAIASPLEKFLFSPRRAYGSGFRGLGASGSEISEIARRSGFSFCPIWASDSALLIVCVWGLGFTRVCKSLRIDSCVCMLHGIDWRPVTIRHATPSQSRMLSNPPTPNPKLHAPSATPSKCSARTRKAALSHAGSTRSPTPPPPLREGDGVGGFVGGGCSSPHSSPPAGG